MSIFVFIILDNGAANNIMQLLRLPCWREYMFSVLKAVRGTEKDVSMKLWNSLQSVLYVIIVGPLENEMYASPGNQVQENDSMKFVYEIFGTVYDYDRDAVRERVFEKGLVADLYVAVCDRIKILLSMPGEKVRSL